MKTTVTPKMLKIRLILALTLFSIQASAVQQHHRHDYIRITGSVTTGEKEAVEFATVYLKGTGYGAATAADGTYGFGAPAGNYTLVVSAVGYQTVERSIGIVAGRANRFDIPVTPEVEQLDEVVVSADGITRVKRSAYNAVAIDTKSLQNTTLDLSGALAKAPGVKLRESGGVGSDMRYTLDGFGGKHIKVFIDGVPQEGVGTAFGLNTIPVNFAERIEVYKGVVPVGFGTDALGGVINVVTGKAKKQRFVDASFSYGSFGTHKVYLNAGQTFKNGLTYQVNAFRNYSRNDYHIDVAVEEFLGPDYTDGSRLNSKNIRRVKRFHDNYHNEAIVVKAGIVDKKWADRLLFGATYAHFYKEIQTGIIQKVVFGGKHRKGYSVMPSMEYSKRGLFTKGLDVSLTANYNRNITRHIDTASYRFNWRAEKQRITSPGEQSYQNTHSKNANLNATFTANYRFSNAHAIVLNHVWSSFRRENSATAGSTSSNTATAIPKETRKNISGLAYRLTPSERWNLSIFGKYYNLFNAGPLSTSTSGSEVFRAADTMGALGYGAAGTYFILKPLQAKLSFERAYRLPTNEEVFGDEDMELGTITLRPELSDNYNFNLSYGRPFGDHAVFIEGGLILRNTKDYIQRRIGSQSGGKTYATYENHGRVATKGFTLSANYNYRNRVSAGGSLTKVDVRDNVRTVEGGSNQVSVTYGARMPNVPYLFANADATLYLHDLRKKGNTAVIAYEMTYLHSFPLYSEVLGNDGGYMVPAQLAHNISLSYSVKGGRYNLSIECRNILDERLYDNFSLQKAGRAFYGKVRVYFGNN